MYNLLDSSGTYFLIHPLENNINRNIINSIILYNDYSINNIVYLEFRYILSYFYVRNLAYDINNINPYLLNDIKYANITTSNIIKTELVDKLLQLKNNLNLEHIDLASTLLAASAMNCEDEVYEILILLETIDNSVNNIISNNMLR